MSVRVYNMHLGLTSDHHFEWLTLFILGIYRTKLLDLKDTIVLSLDESLNSIGTCHTTGVEGTKCKLCTWLSDRLSSYHTNYLTLVYQVVVGQVASIALCTNSLLCFTSEHRADLHLCNWRLLYLRSLGLINLFTSSNNQLT